MGLQCQSGPRFWALAALVGSDWVSEPLFTSEARARRAVIRPWLPWLAAPSPVTHPFSTCCLVLWSWVRHKYAEGEAMLLWRGSCTLLQSRGVQLGWDLIQPLCLCVMSPSVR